MRVFPLLPKSKSPLLLTLKDGQFGLFLFNMKSYGFKWVSNDFTVIFNPNPLKFDNIGNLFEISMQLHETITVFITSNQISIKLTLLNDDDTPIFIKEPNYSLNRSVTIDIPIYTRLIIPPAIPRKLDSDRGIWNINTHDVCF